MSESPTSATHAPSHANGTGKPSEAGSAFAEALIAAVREQESSEGQAQVATALTLGWFLAALGHPGPPSATAAAARGDLLGAGALDDARVVEVCRSHVQAALTKLADVVAPTGLALPELAEAPEEDRCKQATALDAKVQGVLSATDFRVSKAYAVGRALMNLTTHPERGTLAEHLGAAAVAPLAADIDDLGSALAPHAGHSVRASLLEWQTSVASNSPGAHDEPETWLALARQGELWRALLAGEKQGRDMLEIEDYVDAADRLSARMREVAVRLLKRFPEIVIGVVLLFAAGVALIAFAGDSAAAVAAGAGAVLASLGLSWRAVGKSLGGLAGKLERPLWGAELDVAITQAITLLPGAEDHRIAQERRHVALALGASATVVPDGAGSSAVRAADS
jgi:hypothetical protein